MSSMLKPLIKPAGIGAARAWLADQLFRNGEVGAWLEPRDISTLYQDSAGTIPVTTDGDPVGLVLDKSQGYALGQNLVTNGTFESDVSGWTAQLGASTAWENGTLKLVAGVAGTTQRVSTPISCTVGKLYKVTAAIWRGTTTANVFLVGSANANLGSGVPSTGVSSLTPVTVSIKVLATDTTMYVGLNDSLSSAIGATSFIDNVTAVEISENYAYQTVSAYRPNYRQESDLRWISFDGVDDYIDVSLPSISSATVAIAKSTGADITYPVDLSSGTLTINSDFYCIVVLDRMLTANENIVLTQYLNMLAGL